jgi:hypothetical protein
MLLRIFMQMYALVYVFVYLRVYGMWLLDSYVWRKLTHALKHAPYQLPRLQVPEPAVRASAAADRRYGAGAAEAEGH